MFLQRLPWTISTLASHMESREQEEHTELKMFARTLDEIRNCGQRSQSFRPPLRESSFQLWASSFDLSFPPWVLSFEHLAVGLARLPSKSQGHRGWSYSYHFVDDQWRILDRGECVIMPSLSSKILVKIYFFNCKNYRMANFQRQQNTCKNLFLQL